MHLIMAENEKPKLASEHKRADMTWPAVWTGHDMTALQLDWTCNAEMTSDTS